MESWLIYDGGPGSGRHKENFNNEFDESRIKEFSKEAIGNEYKALKFNRGKSPISITGPIGSREKNCSISYNGLLGRLRKDNLTYYEADKIRNEITNILKKGYLAKKDLEAIHWW